MLLQSEVPVTKDRFATRETFDEAASPLTTPYWRDWKKSAPWYTTKTKIFLEKGSEEDDDEAGRRMATNGHIVSSLREMIEACERLLDCRCNLEKRVTREQESKIARERESKKEGACVPLPQNWHIRHTTDLLHHQRRSLAQMNLFCWGSWAR